MPEEQESGPGEVQSKSQCSRSRAKAAREEAFSPTQRRVCLLLLLGPSTDWARPTHRKEGKLYFAFLRLPMSMLFSHRNSLPKHPA